MPQTSTQNIVASKTGRAQSGSKRRPLVVGGVVLRLRPVALFCISFVLLIHDIAREIQRGSLSANSMMTAIETTTWSASMTWGLVMVLTMSASILLIYLDSREPKDSAN